MDSSQTCQTYSTESFKKCQVYVENMHCQRILIVGLLTVYLVNKIQFRLKLYFELFDFFVNIRQNLHDCAKAAKESKLHYPPPPPYNTTYQHCSK